MPRVRAGAFTGAQTTVVSIAAATSQRVCVGRSNGRIRCIEKIFPAARFRFVRTFTVRTIASDLKNVD